MLTPSTLSPFCIRDLTLFGAGVGAARRLLMERCVMRQDDDGVFRGIREPLSGGALGAARKAAAAPARPAAS